jgi:5-methyltetrahydrofolate--homocysteine methyltransferase
LLATVKGDVHDIGKNIVGIVLSCNGYEVIDLGVMVSAETILEAVLREKPDIIGLSGLITPSLEEMSNVLLKLDEAGVTTPVLIGGATTSKIHTAVKLAPKYHGAVVHVRDAAQAPSVTFRLLHSVQSSIFIAKLYDEYGQLRHIQEQRSVRTVAIDIARANHVRLDWKEYPAIMPADAGIHVIEHIPIDTLIPYLHWKFFFAAWRLNPRYSEISELHDCDSCRDSCRASWLAAQPDNERDKAAEALQLYKDAIRLLERLAESGVEYCKAVFGLFPANGDGDDIVIDDTLRLPMLRQQAENKEGRYKSLADFIRPADKGSDYIGAFAVTAGAGIDCLMKKFEKEGDTYNAILLQTLTDRLAEAAAEWLHENVRTKYWGYAPNESLNKKELLREQYVGIRPAVGYPSIPDQSMNFELDKLLGGFERIGISLTENGAMSPTASVSGLYFAHPGAAYFMIGRIDEEQLADYSRRRGISPEAMRPLLSKHL